MNKDILYSNLNYRKVSQKEYNRLNNNIKEFYNIIGDINFYNPYINLFCNYFKDHVSYNNKNKVYKLLKRKSRISVIGYFYKALIKNKNNNFLYKNVFVKELSLISDQNVDLNYIETSFFNPLRKKENDLYYSYNAPSNIEVFVTYLVSKLKEHDISPSFCEFYGVYSVEMDRFTYDITESPELIESLDTLITNKTKNLVRFIQKKDNYYLEYKHIPAYLLITESGGYDISIIENDFNYDLMLSITFQTFCAIITMNNYFGIKHNDLHFGNIMLKDTNEEYIYYKINDKIFKVPTYGFIVKIIDWGRSTYEFNNISYKNDIFNYDSECFGQYIYKKINNKGKQTILPKDCKWSDIVMFSYSLLHEFPKLLKTDLGKMLTKNITSNKKELIDTSKFSWNIYKIITNRNYNIIPKNIIFSKIFKEYQVENDKNEKMYTFNF